MRRVLWLVLAGLALVAAIGVAVASRAEPAGFSGRRALGHARRLMRLGPRTPGSAASAEARQYIADQLRRAGWEVEVERFAYAGAPLANVIARRGQGPIVIVGAHYDTRPIADRDPDDRAAPTPGANDGTSGVAILLELARVLDPAATEEMQVWLAFFDAEDSGGIANWEWAVGSRRLAERLVNQPGNRPEYVIIVDMVGAKDATIHYEWSSSLWLQERLWALAAELGYGDMFRPSYKHHIVADHTPFLQRGIEAAALIDLDYPYWHTQRDTLDKLSAQSIQRVGHLLQAWLEGAPLATRAVVR